MLILTRREGESLVIELSPNVDRCAPVGDLLADGIEIRLLGCGRGKAKIEVDAPLAQATVPASPRSTYMQLV